MLRLHIKSYQKNDNQQPSSKTLDTGVLTIGRDPSNDWSLSDPDRILSKIHCSIEAQGSEYVLKDSSTNGVFVNSSSQVLGRGNTAPIRHGDTIRLGDYEVGVIVEDNMQQSFEPVPAPEVVVPDVPPPPPPLDVETDSSDWKSILEGEPAKAVVPQESEVAVDVPDFAQSHYDAPSVGFSIPDNWGDSTSEQNIPDIGAIPEPAEIPVVESIVPEAQEPTKLANSSQASTSIPVQTSGVKSDNLMQAFLKGAGLDPQQQLAVGEEELMTELGGLFKNITAGLIGVLSARGDIKSEFRLAQTMIRPTENNPLKFSLNVDEAMLALINKRGYGYMSAEDAFGEAFDDIKAHQVAVLSGMQSALQSVLKRFDPAKIEGKKKDSGGVKKILGGQKSKFWDEFVSLYQDTQQEAEDDFQNIFGREFAKAYDQQIKKQKING